VNDTGQTSATEAVGEPNAAGLQQIVMDVWTTLLGLPAEPADPASIELGGRPLLCGSIEVMGQWRGSITVTATTGMATGIAATMFDKRAADVTEDDRRDAVGELTNVMGGNFKAMLAPLESALSLPRVSPGAAPAPTRAERPLGEVALHTDGQALLVRFVAAAPA
jgi:CheY-specific phosphatase CheX